MSNGWIGVDLDGTLARYDGWKGADHIGEPIPGMVNRVKQWLAEGKEVRIFTARVDGGEAAIAAGDMNGEHFRDVERIRLTIQDWTEKHIGARLRVTNVKDYSMRELWDDRAVRVICNSGCTCCEVEEDKQLLDAEAFDHVDIDPFDLSRLTDEEIIRRAQELAREIHRAKGYEVPDGFRFYETDNPRAVEAWNLAVLAFEQLTGTDLTDALAGLEDGQE